MGLELEDADARTRASFGMRPGSPRRPMSINPHPARAPRPTPTAVNIVRRLKPLLSRRLKGVSTKCQVAIESPTATDVSRICCAKSNGPLTHNRLNTISGQCHRYKLYEINPRNTNGV